VPIQSPPTATSFRHRGRTLFLHQCAALQSNRGAGSWIIRSDHSPWGCVISEQSGRQTMSQTDQDSQSASAKHECQMVASPPSRPSKAERPQSRTVRLTVSLPSDLVDRLRDAVYWSPSLTLAWLIAQSLRTSLTEMESFRQCPFPKRTKALRAGRPRLLGQTMNVSGSARLIGIEETGRMKGSLRPRLSDNYSVSDRL
jgi:hypothetical protein